MRVGLLERSSASVNENEQASSSPRNAERCTASAVEGRTADAANVTTAARAAPVSEGGGFSTACVCDFDEL